MYNSKRYWYGQKCRLSILSICIFLHLTLQLAGKYALIGILCLFRHVPWYVDS